MGRIELSKVVLLSVIMTVGSGVSSAQSPSNVQSYKVKSISGGNFDEESRRNLKVLIQNARENGVTTVWVATAAPFDPDVQPSSAEFDAQCEEINQYHSRILRRLKMDLGDADITIGSPYFSIDASVQHLRELLTIPGVKGYWGLVGPARAVADPDAAARTHSE